MLDTELIDHSYYMTYADMLIMENDIVDSWVLDLAATKHSEKAIVALNHYLCEETFNDFGDSYNVTYTACFWIKYENKKISWSDFLIQAGNNADGNQDIFDCEYFYSKHDEFEASEFSIELERSQSTEIKKIYADSISQTRMIYEELLPFREKYFQVYDKK